MTRSMGLKILTIEWITVGVVLSALVFLQTAFGKYGDGEHLDEVWEWLMLGLVPPISMILASALSDDAKAWGQQKANLFRFVFAFLASTAFLASLLVTLLIQPLSEVTAFNLFRISKIAMGLWQGVVLVGFSAVLFDGR